MKTKTLCLCCFLLGIMQVAFGQLSDSTLIIPKDTLSFDSTLLSVDSVLLFQQKLDSLIFLSETKKEELVVLEDQISFLMKKISDFDTTILNNYDSLIIPSDNIDFKNEDSKFIFEITYCSFRIDNITLKIKIKGIKENWTSKFLVGKIVLYEKRKEPVHLGLINQVISFDNDYEFKVSINGKIPANGVIIVVEDLRISVNIDGNRKIFPHPIKLSGIK